MINRPYVEWSQVEDAKGNAISGKEYLVAEYSHQIDDSDGSSKGVIAFNLATWFNAGDTVDIMCKAERNESDSPEEVLVKTLFGSTFKYTIEESGFYIEVFSEKVMDDVFIEHKCEHGFRKLNYVRFWSGLPIPPEGYITWEEAEEIDSINAEVVRQKRYDEEAERMTDIIMNDGLLKTSFNHLLDMGISKDSHIDFKSYAAGVEFHTNTFDEAVSAIAARDLYDIIKVMVASDIKFEDIDGLVRKRDTENLSKTVEGLVGQVDVRSKYIMRKILHVFCNHIYKDDFFSMRDMFKYKYKNKRENIVKILIKTLEEREILFKVYRIYSLLSLGKKSGSDVPEVILQNEFRMLAEAFIRYDSVDSVDNISWVFKERFGVNEDGSKYDGSDTPKLRHKVNSDDYDEDDLTYSVEIIDKDGSVKTVKMTFAEVNILNGFEDSDDTTENSNKEDGVIGVDYPYFAVGTPPNYLMFDAKYVIYDNRNDTVVENEEGEYLLFNDWTEAMKVRTELEDGMIKDR